MKRSFRIALFVLLALSIGCLVTSGYEKAKETKKASKEDLYDQVELFANTISVVRNEYVDEVESKKLIYGALKGMLGSLDDFSSFLEPDEYNEIRLETKGEFGGIGVEISLKEGILTVIAPIAGTPAEAAGVKAGDKIIRIDGKITKDITLSEAVKKMRGAPGTTVNLSIWREKEEKVLEIPIKRDVIIIHSIKKAVKLEEKIGYIKVAEFQERTPRDLEESLKRLEADGIDSLILDLRNNPGGLLDVAADVAEKFLPKDSVILSIRSRAPSEDIVFKSKGRFPHPNYPLIVLVNEGSASASEIVAGAIQDNKRGLILGTKTFGKASVQTVIPLKDGSAIRLTTASYFTPSGKIIRNQGIIPDVIVEREELAQKKEDVFEKLEMKEKDRELDKEKRDNQLERAVDLMKALKLYKTDKKAT